MSNSEEKTNLIINYLPQSMTDDEFWRMFEKIGPLRSAKIIRNKHTNYSYGFGFVNYVYVKDAQTAIAKLNGLQVQHKRIKVAFSRPQCHAIKKAKLYVKNVPLNFTEKDLESLFSKYGKIIQCRLLDGEAKKKGIAFVLYDLHDQAEKAIESLNGVLLNGASYPLEIKYATDNKQNRSWNMSDESYHSRSDYRDSPYYDSIGFSPLQTFSFLNTGLIGGPIRNADYGKSHNRYNPFDNQYLRGMSDYDASKYAHSSQYSSSSKNNVLFVYNIGAQVNEDMLSDLFLKFGPVIKAQVMRKGNESRGYGFVTMRYHEDAVNAIHALNGFNFRGKSLQVNFKR
ncbi:ELAV-like protein 2 [Dinothrombium tinctorium]|uniref:ELAV-like protein 2 n=1 Tax=Dinothrombium tinctorium TaxID=1965070 RepID=A0A3S3PE80_9ACAR|nr:ELAV-like protein 2 [Dinothrombium tinctorium]RWS14045.1 ELAV-like protein 2 [Dinothrombium tinctorium]